MSDAPRVNGSSRERGIPWRRWSIALHRDERYVAAALTIAYSISGIAVNHIADWNPNYLKGRTGITGRGAWLTAAGLLPVVYWLAFLR